MATGKNTITRGGLLSRHNRPEPARHGSVICVHEQEASHPCRERRQAEQAPSGRGWSTCLARLSCCVGKQDDCLRTGMARKETEVGGDEEASNIPASGSSATLSGSETSTMLLAGRACLS